MHRNMDREKEIKLLHLDNMQRETLSNIIDKFLLHKTISLKESVEAFVHYSTKLFAASFSRKLYFCDNDGNLTSEADTFLQRFCDTIFLCSGIQINYSKILNSSGIKQILSKAVSSKNAHTQNISELQYRIKVLAYKVLENNSTEIKDYISDTEEKYMSSLATINKEVMQHAFIEHIVDIISNNNDQTISDIATLANKYSKYLGISFLTESLIEELIQKYSDIECYRDIGAIHSARIEMFRLMASYSSDISKDLRKYTAYQLVDYINEQTNGKSVSSEMMQNLGVGVTNICNLSFGEEYFAVVKKESPRILRAILETNQLDFSGKVLKFLDNTRILRGDSMVTMILADIFDRNKIENYSQYSQQTDMIKSSWVEKMKIEDL